MVRSYTGAISPLHNRILYCLSPWTHTELIHSHLLTFSAAERGRHPHSRQTANKREDLSAHLQRGNEYKFLLAFACSRCKTNWRGKKYFDKSATVACQENFSSWTTNQCAIRSGHISICYKPAAARCFRKKSLFLLLKQQCHHREHQTQPWTVFSVGLHPSANIWDHKPDQKVTAKTIPQWQQTIIVPLDKTWRRSRLEQQFGHGGKGFHKQDEGSR